MYLLGDHSPAVNGLLRTANQAAQALTRVLPEKGLSFDLMAGAILGEHIPKGQIIVLRAGTLTAALGGRVGYIHQAGDIFGFEGIHAANEMSYQAEEPVSLMCYETEPFYAWVAADPTRARLWNDYLTAVCALFGHAYTDTIKDQHRPQAGFIRFRAGDTIVRQNDPIEHVYTMMRGSARVLVDGVEVGEVRDGEVFGAIAAINQSPRTATIVAREDCTVMAVPEEQFVALLQAHPDTAMQVMQGMARIINDLNRKLAETQKHNQPHV
ncbi:MAG: hypothetical protein D6758_09145 [Gammaproteobacteria bacterium]|nr:MAG: hypothetical protein D6758_09145 [Gammaproteobacteria bacterium]